MGDEVNHPAHYNAHPSGVECITIVEHMNFNVGNAIKYLWRAGLKKPSGVKITPPPATGSGEKFIIAFPDKHLEDLEKARWYIDREIERISPK